MSRGDAVGPHVDISPNVLSDTFGASDLRGAIVGRASAPFLRAECEEAVLVSNTEGPVAAAPVRWKDAPAVPGRRARVASLGPACARVGASGERDGRRGGWYAVILQIVAARRPRPDLICVDLDPSSEDDADTLWRLGLALDGRCQIRETNGAVRVTIVLGGAIAAIAAARSSVSASDLQELRRLARRPVALWRRLASGSNRAGAALTTWQASTETGMARSIVVPNLVFERVSLSEVVRRPARYGVALTWPARRFANVECFAARLRGELAYRMWISFDDRTQLPGASAPAFGRRIARIWGCYTLPRFRGRSIYPAALQWAIAVCRDRGMHAVVLEVAADNEPSLRGVRKAGFVPVQRQ